MFVKRHGSGPDAYFCLHGWSGDHRTFDPLLPFVPDGARLYAADLPGCGESAAPERWELSAVSREIGAAIAECGAPVTLVGNCIGALLGMRAALEGPERVRRLVLIDAFAFWPWYFRVFTARGWGRYAYACAFANPVGRWIANRSLASKRAGDSDLTEGFARARHEVALRYLDLVGQFQSAEEFSALSLPVDVVFGARSFGAVRESAAVWRGLWPWARIWELKGAGHLPIREAAQALGEIVFGGEPCPKAFGTISTRGAN